MVHFLSSSINNDREYSGRECIMLEHTKIRNLDDYFTELNSRQKRGVFFYRINGYSEEIGNFIKKYYSEAGKKGVIIEGKIPNPDERNLSYYGEIMGMDFQMNQGFIAQRLRKWMPGMNDSQRNNVSAALYDSLDSMRRAGKTENILKNAYIKFMCWLYYRFAGIVSRLGENSVPKILYEGDISNYELMMISVLSKAGCDVILLQYHGDQAYLKADPESSLSDALQMAGMKEFPAGYSLKKVREDIRSDLDREKLYGTKSALINCTNAWAKGQGIEDIREPVSVRGTDSGFFYNCFCRINGVEDKLTYTNELYKFQQELRSSGRKLVIVNEEIPKPTPEEIARIKRGNYAALNQMLSGLAANIKYPASIELQKIMNKAFVELILEESQKEGSNLNRTMNKAVYLLCWLKRYETGLFEKWKQPDIGCFIYLGGCCNDSEALFLRFLARLPVDVLILCPDLNKKCCLTDALLYELNYTESLSMTRFPEESSRVQMGTAAYYAERELDTLMYQDTGLYRNRQYSKANVVSLQTMYEEIKLLWDQELKYRPGFSTTDHVVNIPVIFAKVSGVKDGSQARYWASVRELITPDTILIEHAPYIEPSAPNPMKACSVGFLKNGKLQRTKIKEHREYRYGILREEMQDFMLDKLQMLLDQKLIKGIGQNGTEYTVTAVVLNLSKDIIRMIQKFDFTKKNPKLVYINAGETAISLEDSVLAAFLNLIGFDIIFFVPTGYQCVEKYFNGKLMEEHQIGEYLYDLQVPDLRNFSLGRTRRTWRDKLFKR